MAVSGGGDSVALLLILHVFAKTRRKKLTALTVDHGLRPESTEEAEWVSGFCADREIPHHILSWQGEKPTSGLPEAAREARYALMTGYCRLHDIGVLALGHTQDDQAETLLMRLRRSPTGRGMSGMDRQVWLRLHPHHDLLLVRPLLKCGRAQLRGFLHDENVPWIDDPTNEDVHYERVQARDILFKDETFKTDLLKYGTVMARHRQLMSNAAARIIGNSVSLTEDFGFEVKTDLLEKSSESVALLALRAVISVAGGRDYLPEPEKIRAALRQEHRVNLSRTLFFRKNGMIFINRESRNLPERVMIKQMPVLWDNRFWVMPKKNSEMGWELIAGSDIADKNIFRTMPYSKVYNLKPRSGDDVWEPVQMTSSLTIQPTLGAFEKFCPAFDQAIRSAFTHLFRNLVHHDP